MQKRRHGGGTTMNTSTPLLPEDVRQMDADLVTLQG